METIFVILGCGVVFIALEILYFRIRIRDKDRKIKEAKQELRKLQELQELLYLEEKKIRRSKIKN